MAAAGGIAEVQGGPQAVGCGRDVQGDRVVQFYNLSDEQFEYQLRDRLSFMRFLGLGLEDAVPDATTVCLDREQLVQAWIVDELFDAALKEQGWLAMGGQIFDASIVPVHKQRNSRDENAAIKAGDTPEGLGREAGQEAPERHGRALDQETQQVALRV